MSQIASIVDTTLKASQRAVFFDHKQPLRKVREILTGNKIGRKIGILECI
jgi:hypothetical protein